jgi:predicted HicB family RNase H-like nuclease
MGKTSASKGRGGKLGRSAIVTVRLDPKLRFFVELAARKERRTVSSFMELAVEEVINKVFTGDVMDRIWDTDETVRFVKLATHLPEFLNSEQRKTWERIEHEPACWKKNKPDYESIRDFLSRSTQGLTLHLTSEQLELLALSAKQRKISVARLVQRMVNREVKDFASDLGSKKVKDHQLESYPNDRQIRKTQPPRDSKAQGRRKAH